MIGLALYLFMRKKANTVLQPEFHTPEYYSEPTVPEAQPGPGAQTVAEPTPASKPVQETRETQVPNSPPGWPRRQRNVPIIILGPR